MRKVLFFGEIYPNSINGVSVANLTNLNFLKEKVVVDIIIEENNFRDHEKISCYKIITILRQLFKVLIKSACNRYDTLYLVFSLSILGGIKTLLAIICYRFFINGNVIIHIHRGDFFLNFYTNVFSKQLSNLIFKLTDRLIVLSDNQKVEMSVFKSLKIEVLYNTVESEQLNINVNRRNKKFIYISNYLPQKGIFELLDVFKELKDLYPNILLETYGAFSDEGIKKRILNYCDKNIYINSTVQGDEKYHKLITSDCLVLPSWNEGQPLVILEAMSVGLPIISTKVGLIPELLGEDYVYLANPQDVNSLKDKIVEFINSIDNDLISIQLKEKYNQLYCREKHKNRLFEIFDCI